MAIFLWSSLALIGLGITIAALSTLTFKHLWFLKYQSKLSILLLSVISRCVRLTQCVGSRHYTYYNLLHETACSTMEFSHLIAGFAEIIVYIQVGITLVILNGYLLLILTSIVSIYLACFIVVFFLSW